MENKTTLYKKAKTGKILWSEEYDGTFWSSPILVGDNIYITDQEGNSSVFRLAETYQLLGEGKVGERVMATLAFADAKIYLRTEKHLFCIGMKS